MPSPSLVGSQLFTYGVPPLTGVAVQNYTLDVKSANVITVVNETGNVIDRRRDDLTSNLSIEAVLGTGYALPNPGDILIYPIGGTHYEVEDYSVKGSNKQAVMLTIKLINSQYISI